MDFDRLYRIKGTIIEKGMILKVFYIDTVKQGRFLEIVDSQIKLDCSDKYSSNIARISMSEIQKIEIVKEVPRELTWQQ